MHALHFCVYLLGILLFGVCIILFPCIQVVTYFPSSKVTSVRLFSAFRSSTSYYGFTMAMVVKLVSTTTQGDIAAAHRSLGNARYIGRQRLRSKGLRAFAPSGEYVQYYIITYYTFVGACLHVHVNCVCMFRVVCV